MINIFKEISTYEILNYLKDNKIINFKKINYKVYFSDKPVNVEEFKNKIKRALIDLYK